MNKFTYFLIGAFCVIMLFCAMGWTFNTSNNVKVDVQEKYISGSEYIIVTTSAGGVGICKE